MSNSHFGGIASDLIVPAESPEALTEAACREQEERLRGIWTERDRLQRELAENWAEQRETLFLMQALRHEAQQDRAEAQAMLAELRPEESRRLN
jgi:hypothetical protein